MKGNDWLLVGTAGLAAYFIFFKKQDAAPPVGGGGGGGIIEQIVPAIVDTLPVVPSGLLDTAYNLGQQFGSNNSNAIIGLGGDALRFVNAGRYKTFAPGAASVLSNIDFLNVVRGGEYVQATIRPTASGSGLLQLRGNTGAADMIQAQYQIDQAVRAATAPTYGVSLASGGANVFNIGSSGTAWTSQYTPPNAAPGGSNTPAAPAGNGLYSPYTPPYTPANNGWYSPA